MSDLQRRALTGEATPRNRGSRPTSKTSSRSQSRYASDDEEDEYMGNTFLSPKLDADLLATNLSNLSVLDESTDDKSLTLKDKFSSSVEVLVTDRRSTSLELRQNALYTIIQLVSYKYDPEKFQIEGLFPILAKAFVTSRSEQESLLAVKALCITATVDIDEACETLNSADILPLLFEKLTIESISTATRANLTLGYSLLQYMVNFGSGGYKVDTLTEELLDVANSCSTDENAIAVAAILGAGLLVTILSSPNSAIADFLPITVDFLESGSNDVRAAAGKVIALFYQIYDYDYDSDEDNEDEDEQMIPFVEHGEILTLLKELSSAGIRKVSKKDKKEQKSIFRDVSRFIPLYTSKTKRAEITAEDVIITHVKLSRSKSMVIDSWAKLLVIQHFKWAFGQGFHTQAANNPLLRECLAASGPPSSRHTGDYGSVVADNSAGNLDAHAQPAERKLANVERTKLIRSQRLQKELESTFAVKD